MKTSDQTTIAVVRTFQAQATMENFDLEKFKKGRVKPIKKLLDDNHPDLKAIVVVVCGDQNSPHGEIVTQGSTPTINHLRQAFPTEVENGKIIPIICRNWGGNVGSSTALNAGIDVALKNGAHNVLAWSPRVPLTGLMLDEMLDHQAEHNLTLVGYVRRNWYRQMSWMFAQNNCALWSAELLHMINGMNPDCNGIGETVEVGEQQVSLAGMEDIEGYLRASRSTKCFFPWGMVGIEHPVEGDESLKLPGTPEFEKHQMKNLRQNAVMTAYAQKHYPELSPEEVFENIFCVVRFA